jgi:hypothetical protein
VDKIIDDLPGTIWCLSVADGVAETDKQLRWPKSWRHRARKTASVRNYSYAPQGNNQDSKTLVILSCRHAALCDECPLLALKVALQYRMSDTVGVAAGCDVERTRHSTSAFGALAAEPVGIGLDEIAAKFAVGRCTFDILARAAISPRCLPRTR